MDNSEIFKDLLIVELAGVLAGPAVGMFFAELGARVIKIENKSTGGDVTRKWKLPQEDPADEYSAYYHSINWGKEKMILDLNDSEDYEQVLSLIKKADVVISNYKIDSAGKLKMDYDSLKIHNPKLIYGSISAYGDDNPAPGFDAMLQAETGWIFMTGEKNGAPVKMPVALVDVLTGHQLKQGILVALLKRQSTGQGSFVSVSLFDASVASLANQASNWLNVNVLPQRKGSQHPNIAPYGDIFYTKDKKGLLLGTGTQKQYEGLCDCLRLEELKTDKRFLTNTLRLTNRAALNAYLEKAFAERQYDELKKECDRKKVTIAPINNMEEVFKTPAAQELILTEAFPSGKIAKCVRTTVFKIK